MGGVRGARRIAVLQHSVGYTPSGSDSVSWRNACDNFLGFIRPQEKYIRIVIWWFMSSFILSATNYFILHCECKLLDWRRRKGGGGSSSIPPKMTSSTPRCVRKLIGLRVRLCTYV